MSLHRTLRPASLLLLALALHTGGLLAQPPTGGDAPPAPPSAPKPLQFIAPPPGTPSDPKVQKLFSQAEAEETAGRSGPAIGAYQRIVKKFPVDPLAQTAQFRLAVLLDRQNNFDKAFEAYDALVTAYPNTDNFNKSVERQFEIATMYLESQKSKFLGFLPSNSNYEKAAQMFGRIVQTAPFTSYAPLAQFNIGLAFEKMGQADEARAAYQQVVDKYPNHDVADDAQYQIGYLYSGAVKKGAQSSGAKVKATEAFEDFLFMYPGSEKLDQAQENLSMIKTKSAADLIEIAKFYDKQKNWKAAAIYYNEAATSDPQSPAGQAAAKRLAQLKTEKGEEIAKVLEKSAKASTGDQLRDREKIQSQVDTKNRPDYVGPPLPPDPPLPSVGETPGSANLAPAVRTDSPSDSLPPLPPLPDDPSATPAPAPDSTAAPAPATDPALPQ